MVPPHSAVHRSINLDNGMYIETRTGDGQLIERLKVDLSRSGHHAIYNIAGASPLIEWTAVYGNAREQDPHLLGAPRLTSSRVSLFFEKPPQSLKTKGSGSTLTVLDAIDNRAPEQMLKLAATELERQRMTLAHATWDPVTEPHLSEWKALAQR